MDSLPAVSCRALIGCVCNGSPRCNNRCSKAYEAKYGQLDVGDSDPFSGAKAASPFPSSHGRLSPRAYKRQVRESSGESDSTKRAIGAEFTWSRGARRCSCPAPSALSSGLRRAAAAQARRSGSRRRRRRGRRVPGARSEARNESSRRKAAAREANGESGMSSADESDDVTVTYLKLATQLCSTLFSSFVGVGHVLQIVKAKRAEREQRRLDTPMLGDEPPGSAGLGRYTQQRSSQQLMASQHSRAYAGGQYEPPAARRFGRNSTSTTDTHSNSVTASESRTRTLQQRHNMQSGPDLRTEEPEDGRSKASVASRILRVFCFTDWLFSITGAIVTAIELFDAKQADDFQVIFWLQAPHWCGQVASFCWVATLGLYISKRRGRSSFDVAIAHAIIWMIVVFYWVLELYASYYGSTGFVHAAQIIWKVIAVVCFMIVSLAWLSFARRWRKQARKKGAYVVSKLLSYTVAFFILVGPIVVVEVAQGLHTGGVLLDVTSFMLAMWPTVNAIIYLTKPTLCLRFFQTETGGRGGPGVASGQSNGNLAARRGNGPNSGQMVLMSPTHHELKGLNIGDKIGEGIAVVYRGKWRGADVAVKMKSLMLDNSEDLQEFQHACNVEIQAEAEVMKGLCHPNIVLFMEAGFYRGSIVIISEYCARGSLRDVLKRANVKQLSWPTKLRLALGICHGIQYLHNANPPMIHRDLKSPNVLVDDSWHAKIADFGTLRFSEIVSSAQIHNSMGSKRSMEMTGLVGTTRWMAPEVMRGEKIYTSKVDIYSLALILWELIEGKLPFESTRWNHEIEDYVLRGLRPVIRHDQCPSRWKLLIMTCWQADPRERPTIQQVISSLQRIAREEVWDTTGPRFTGVSQLSASTQSSIMAHSMISSTVSASYMDSPPGLGGGERRYPRTQWQRLTDALDENVLSESDSDAEAFAEEFSHLHSMDSPAILGGSFTSSSSSSRPSSLASSGASVNLNASSSSSNARSKRRPDWRRRTDTIEEGSSSSEGDSSHRSRASESAPDIAIVASSPNGTPFIVNI